MQKAECRKQKIREALYCLLPTAFCLPPRERSERGFTLVEMIVAVGLFAIVMLIAVTTLLSLIDANRKARTLQSVVNNLNVALDGMVRSLRMGNTYRCGGGDPVLGGPNSCPNGDTSLSFINNDGVVIEYEWDSNAKRLQITRGAGLPAYLTAPEVQITEMTFYVSGTTPGDTAQPKVVMLIKGIANAAQTKLQSTFSIQSTAVQRVLDL